MRGTADQYKVSDRKNFNQSVDGSAHYLHDLILKFHGDMAKAVAAYNWGPGNVDRDIQRHGAAWKSYLPTETKDYLKKVLPAVIVTINNNTGGSAVATINQVAQQ